MLVSISLNGHKKIRDTKWFTLYYTAEEFKPGKSNHMLQVEFKSGNHPSFSIVVDAGGSDSAGEDAVFKFANKLPDTVDASYLKSFAKKNGMSVIED